MSWPSPPLQTQRVQEHTRAPAQTDPTTRPTQQRRPGGFLNQREASVFIESFQQRSAEERLDKIQ